MPVAMARHFRRFTNSAPTRTAVPRTSRDEWVATTRRMAAIAGMAAMVGLGVAGQPALHDRLSLLGFTALAVATGAGWLEARRQKVEKATSSAPDSSLRGHWLAAMLLITLASALAIQTWFRVGTAIAFGDVQPPDGIAWVSRIFEPWTWSGSNLGGASWLELQVPWAVVLGGVHILGGSAELAQRLWYTLLFSTAGLFALILLKTLGMKPLPSLLGAGIYLFNAYVVSTVNVNPVYMAALALLPVLPAIVIGAATKRIRVRTAIVLTGFLAPMLGYVYLNPPLLGLLLSVALLAIPYVAWVHGTSAASRSLVVLGLGLALVLALSTYWIVPALGQIGTVSGDQLAALSSWTWTEDRATIANALWLNTNWAWGFPAYFPFASAYDTMPLSVLKFMLPVVAFSALGLRQDPSEDANAPFATSRLRIVVALASMALFLTFISTGTKPPGNTVFGVLYALPGGWLLREPGRFLMAVALAYAVLVGISVGAINSVYPFNVRLRGRTLLGGMGRAAWRALPVGIVLVAMVPAYPLFAGMLVPDSRSPFPSGHVKVPAYWTEMATFIDAKSIQGAVLVLPPDDFYQMPYTWGYYGTDAFIPNMLVRPVVVPNGQAYGTTSPQLLSSVRLVADSLLSGNWTESEALLNMLGTPLVLVRGDVQTPFQNRQIIPPSRLASALAMAPNFELVHVAGPLKLYKSTASGPTIGEGSPSFATVNTAQPDLRVLSLVAPINAIVTSKPIPGVATIIEAPPISEWVEAGSALTTDLVAPPGWSYQVGILDAKPHLSQAVNPDASQMRNQANAASQGARNSSVSEPVTARLTQTGDGTRINLKVAARNVLDNGGFRDGLWEPLGNCAGTYIPTATPGSPLTASLLPAAGPGGSTVLQLSARFDSACEAQTLKWRSGPVVISLYARHVAGALPRLCLWEIGPDRCASIQGIATGGGWNRYRAAVTPDEGTLALRLFVYSDVYNTGVQSVNEYADVHAWELLSIPQVDVMGSPDSSPSQPVELRILRIDYSPNWVASTGAEHVLVNGLLNGWLSKDRGRVSLTYRPAKIISMGFIVSTGVGVNLVLVCAFWAITAAWRLIRSGDRSEATNRT